MFRSFTYLSDPVVLRESVIIKYCKHQSLVKCVSVGKVLKLESFIEERIQSFAVNFCLKLLHPLCLRHQKYLEMIKDKS